MCLVCITEQFHLCVSDDSDECVVTTLHCFYSCNMTQTQGHGVKLENMAIANALQLEANDTAQSLSSLISPHMSSLKSLSLPVAIV